MECIEKSLLNDSRVSKYELECGICGISFSNVNNLLDLVKHRDITADDRPQSSICSAFETGNIKVMHGSRVNSCYKSNILLYARFKLLDV